MALGTDGSGMEIAHVLFIDTVGYSKLLTNEQRGGGHLENALNGGTGAVSSFRWTTRRSPLHT